MGALVSWPSNRIVAILGLALVSFPLLFFTAMVMEYEMGLPYLSGPIDYFTEDPERFGMFNLISPFVLLGSLFAALAANLYPVLRVKFRREEDVIVTTMVVRLGIWNLVVVAISGFLLATLLAYAFVENLNHV